jgi:hypothetical protein
MGVRCGDKVAPDLPSVIFVISQQKTPLPELWEMCVCEVHTETRLEITARYRVFSVEIETPPGAPKNGRSPPPRVPLTAPISPGLGPGDASARSKRPEGPAPPRSTPAPGYHGRKSIYRQENPRSGPGGGLDLLRSTTNNTTLLAKSSASLLILTDILLSGEANLRSSSTVKIFLAALCLYDKRETTIDNAKRQTTSEYQHPAG